MTLIFVVEFKEKKVFFQKNINKNYGDFNWNYKIWRFEPYFLIIIKTELIFISGKMELCIMGQNILGKKIFIKNNNNKIINKK